MTAAVLTRIHRNYARASYGGRLINPESSELHFVMLACGTFCWIPGTYCRSWDCSSGSTFFSPLSRISSIELLKWGRSLRNEKILEHLYHRMCRSCARSHSTPGSVLQPALLKRDWTRTTLHHSIESTWFIQVYVFMYLVFFAIFCCCVVIRPHFDQHPIFFREKRCAWDSSSAECF